MTMVAEAFRFTVENKFNANAAGENLSVRVIPVHGKGSGGTIPPNTSAMPFTLVSSDGYIIFKLRCLHREIDVNDYITFDTGDKVQLSVTNKWWRFKIARKQEKGSNDGLPVSVEVGSYEGRQN
ncbi:MAG: hypothetical protein PVH61_37935 [Candidatus Aminicenantes bacterium]